ncbi:MAG: cytochrome c oxidase subunit II [Elusimicrobia bacterium]|nr:cytochrome c oxidase subunit II [Elusimicrobiota bacterium]
MPYLPQASTVSLSIDRYFLGSLALCLAVLLMVTFFLVYFSLRYSRKRNPQPTDIEGNALLEAVWTVVPLILFLALFYFGWTDFRTLRNPPPDSMTVKVTARQWAWSFEYPNGKRSEELFSALGRPMRLELNTLDVIHGFYIPAFRIKIDVVPNRTATAWFLPRLLGDFDIQCSVICGLDHSAMLSKVRVVSEEDFRRWYFSDEGERALAKASGGKPGKAGANLLEEHGCLACHTLDGGPSVGPTLKGLFGSMEKVEGRAEALKADEAFLRKEILEPEALIIEGYPPVMPPNTLDKEETELVLDYLKELK